MAGCGIDPALSGHAHFVSITARKLFWWSCVLNDSSIGNTAKPASKSRKTFHKKIPAQIQKHPWKHREICAPHKIQYPKPYRFRRDDDKGNKRNNKAVQIETQAAPQVPFHPQLPYKSRNENKGLADYLLPDADCGKSMPERVLPIDNKYIIQKMEYCHIDKCFPAQ